MTTLAMRNMPANMRTRESQKEIQAEASGAHTRCAARVWHHDRSKGFRADFEKGRSGCFYRRVEAATRISCAQAVGRFPAAKAAASTFFRSEGEKRTENIFPLASPLGSFGRPIFFDFVIQFVWTDNAKCPTKSQMKLTTAKRAAILRCLIEGNSARATVRITGAAKDTVLALLERAGEACLWYQDQMMHDLPCTELQLDEVWSFVGCREGTKKKAVGTHPGDVWTWTAICATTKIIPTWRVGDRSSRTGFAFCADLAARVKSEGLQITSDGHPVYRWAVGANFEGADFAMLIKLYGKDPETGKDIVTGIRKEPVQGNPDLAKVSTSYAERANLTIRMGNRRFTRLTNGYSKKLANHRHMLAIQIFTYNFCRKHMTLKQTPAQAAGVAEKEWSTADVIEMMDEYFQRKLEAEFERAFDEKYTPQRSHPKSYEPIRKQAELPWYLDMSRDTPPDDLDL